MSSRGVLDAVAGGSRAVELAPRRAVLALALGLPLSALFLWLAARALDPGRVVDAVGAADVRQLALAVAAMVGVFGLQSLRWRRIARHDARLPRRRFFGFVIASVACNNVVPGRPGELLRVYLLSECGRISRARALATVVVDRTADLLVLVGLLAASYPLLPHPAWLERLGMVLVPLAGALLTALAVAWLYARRRRARPAGPGSGAQRLRRITGDVLTGVAQSLNVKDGLVVSFLSVVVWCGWGLAAWLVAGSLGIALSPVDVAFVTALLNLGTAIPSSPGFVGTYQWLSVTSLGLFAVTRADAFAFSILMQAVWFAPTTLGGLALAVRQLGRGSLQDA